MYKFVDLTGKTYGERTIVGLSHQHPISKNYYWIAICKCGRQDVVSGSRLKKGTKCISCSAKVNGRKGLDSQAKGLPCYFIKCGDYIKIGSSNNVKARIKQMMSNNPYPLELLFVDTINSEKYWHEKLQKYLHRGEWYHYAGSCEIVDLV